MILIHRRVTDVFPPQTTDSPMLVAAFADTQSHGSRRKTGHSWWQVFLFSLEISLFIDSVSVYVANGHQADWLYINSLISSLETEGLCLSEVG